jgi:putative tributyrin esterase
MVTPDKFSKYRPIELSDSRYESDNVRHLTFYSSVLRGRGDVSLYIPPSALGLENVPIVLLLHGVFGSHTSWFHNGGAHRTAHAMMESGEIRPMVLVCPSDGLAGDGAGYLPHPERNCEAWICEDVLGCVRESLPCVARGPVFLGGLSMGAYGALRLGAKYPGLFAGISAHSTVTKLTELNQFVREPIPTTGLGADEPDILYWMKTNRADLPPIRMDCGSEDPLFVSNCALHKAMEEEKIPHEFIVNTGHHSWEYWSEHIAGTLLFFDSVARRGSSAAANSSAAQRQ